MDLGIVIQSEIKSEGKQLSHIKAYIWNIQVCKTILYTETEMNIPVLEKKNYELTKQGRW